MVRWHLEQAYPAAVHCEQAGPVLRRALSTGDLASLLLEHELDSEPSGLAIVTRRTFCELQYLNCPMRHTCFGAEQSGAVAKFRWADIEYDSDGGSTVCPNTDDGSDTGLECAAIVGEEDNFTESVVKSTGFGRALAAVDEPSMHVQRPKDRRPAVRRLQAQLCDGRRSDIPESFTTLLLRNLPPTCTTKALAEALARNGLSGHFRFAYVPADFQSWRAIGYAIVDCISHASALHVMDHLSGRCLCESASVEVSWNEPHQGLDVQIAKYRNSSVAHASVPDDLRPMLFSQGARLDFPAPTARIKAPRIRAKRVDSVAWCR